MPSKTRNNKSTKKSLGTKAAKAGNRSKGSSLVTTAPVSSSTVQRMQQPQFGKVSNNGRITVRHREYIADIEMSVAFAVHTTIPVNPGQSDSFPWLSRIAQNYESYTFKTLNFVYEPQCSSATAGSVMLVLDYDAADLPPASKIEAMSFNGAVRCGAWQNAKFVSSALNNIKFSKDRYVRTDATLTSNLDIKTYDLGNFYLCTQGGLAATCGELYVEYVVEFMTPQLSEATPESGLLESNVNAVTLEAIVWDEDYGNFLTLTDHEAVGDAFTINEPGQYLIAVVWAEAIVSATAAFYRQQSGGAPAIMTPVAGLDVTNSGGIMLYVLETDPTDVFWVLPTINSGTVDHWVLRVAAYAPTGDPGPALSLKSNSKKISKSRRGHSAKSDLDKMREIFRRYRDLTVKGMPESVHCTTPICESDGVLLSHTNEGKEDERPSAGTCKTA